MILNFGGQIASWTYIVCACYFYRVFSSELILLSIVFTVFRGASHLTTALVYDEAAAFTKDRTSTFSLLEALVQKSQLLGPTFGSLLLLKTGIFVPFFVLIPLAATSLLLVLLLPSRVSRLEDGNKDADETGLQYLQTEESTALSAPNGHHYAQDKPELEPLIDSDQVQPRYATWWTKRPEPIWKLTQRLRDILDDARQHPIVLYACAAMLVTTSGKQVLHILLQYVSKRFGVSIAESIRYMPEAGLTCIQAGFLFTVKAAVVLLLYIFMDEDRSLTRASCKHSSGKNIWSIIPGLVIFALGFGFPVLVRSLVTNAATANGTSIPLLYKGLAYVETTGSLIGATALTAAFTGTIRRGGMLAGLPFFISAPFYAIMAVPTFIMKFDPAVDSTEDLDHSYPE